MEKRAPVVKENTHAHARCTVISDKTTQGDRIPFSVHRRCGGFVFGCNIVALHVVDDDQWEMNGQSIRSNSHRLILFGIDDDANSSSARRRQKKRLHEYWGHQLCGGSELAHLLTSFFSDSIDQRLATYETVRSFGLDSFFIGFIHRFLAQLWPELILTYDGILFSRSMQSLVVP